MSTPPTSNKQVALALSKPEMNALEKFANDHGMTTDEAATYAAQQQLQARFLANKRFNNVLRFQR